MDEHENLGYKDELRYFLNCALGEEQQIKGAGIEDGFNVLRSIYAICRSNREGKLIKLVEIILTIYENVSTGKRIQLTL